MSTRHRTTHPTNQPAGSRWRQRAACRDNDPDLFFPTAAPGTPAHDRQAAPAKKVCRRCPVTADCLAEAFARIPNGVAGGLTEHEREQARRGGRKARTA
ncbi:WhiB family transcriptional regulator [Pseudonocardia sp. MH-G8]|uniref:WhiB family transcriptional regulator n=1 Tax=Pseudonocardia sp. MH-G8 TaxID=1854588 RepID=UPI000B9FA6B2|nr:WhiB family transcriptional regulator [Pseudonocardia sp. MH-G8]OZM80047.1 transcription factor WhiB [Pseudonocardia sp. MH-G8]